MESGTGSIYKGVSFKRWKKPRERKFVFEIHEKFELKASSKEDALNIISRRYMMMPMLVFSWFKQQNEEEIDKDLLNYGIKLNQKWKKK